MDQESPIGSEVDVEEASERPAGIHKRAHKSLNRYQEAAAATASFKIGTAGRAQLIPLLGLATESGSLLNIVKKHYRQEESLNLQLSSEFIKEELADLLWYLAVAAKTMGFTLSDVARLSLERTRDQYSVHTGRDVAGRETALSDSSFPEGERFPRRLIFLFEDEALDGGRRTAQITLMHAEPNAYPDGVTGKQGRIGYAIGQSVGSRLNDNSRRVDGYRFHDAIHMAFMTHLGWSPVMRLMLGVKRKSDPAVDDNEDGARALFTEEAIAAALARFATRSRDYADATFVDSDALDLIAAVRRDLEVEALPMFVWRPAIVSAFAAKRTLEDNQGGWVVCDLDCAEMTYYDTYHSFDDVKRAAFGAGAGGS